MKELLNIDAEWEFIQKEVHRDKPNKNNLLQREVLLGLEILLANSYFHTEYKQLKSHYIRIKNNN